MFFKTTMIAVALASVATMARADVAAGDACAAKLTADGKLVYAAVVAANPTLQNLRDTVEPYIRLEAAITGDLQEANAEHREIFEAFRRGDAEAAAHLCCMHCEHTAARLKQGLGKSKN